MVLARRPQIPRTVTETTTSEPPSTTSRSGRTRTWLRRAWPYLFIAVLAIGSSALHVAQNTSLSPIDETRNLDYMVRIFDDGYFVKLGDRIGQKAMRIEACRGIDLELPTPNPSCTSRRFDPRAFRDDGYNNVVSHPPGYHLVTGAFAKAATLLGISNNELDPARLVGGFWLAAGLMLALFAGELLRIPRVPLVAAATIFAMAPDALNSAAIVNPDAAGIFAGGLVLVAALLWERGRISTWWLAVAGLIVAALKLTNFIAIGIVILWLLVQALRQHRDPEPDRPNARRYVIACGVLLSGAVACTIVLLGVYSVRATIDPLVLPSNLQFYHPRFPAARMIEPWNLFSLFPAGAQAYRVPVLTTNVITDLSLIAGWLSVTAMVARSLRFSPRDRLSTLGTAALVVLVLSGPAFIISTWATNKVVFLPPPRYALSAFPIVIVLVASLVRGRPSRIAISAFAVLMACVILGTLVFG